MGSKNKVSIELNPFLELLNLEIRYANRYDLLSMTFLPYAKICTITHEVWSKKVFNHTKLAKKTAKLMP